MASKYRRHAGLVHRPLGSRRMPAKILPNAAEPQIADVARRAAVLARLDEVLDPELDRPVTAMGFIDRVTVEGDEAEVTFRLPTFWCAANFAFLMAQDIKAAIESVPGISRGRVQLLDHFAARPINRGVAEGRSFAEIFSHEATEDLAELRRTFREKAYLGRQERLLRALVGRWGEVNALGLTVEGLQTLAASADDEIRPLALRYLAARRHYGGSDGPGGAAFTRLDGTPVTAKQCSSHLRDIRRIRASAEANAEMCSLLLAARGAPPAVP
jgi:metal-sulfur cluster biosynthetic enzyme